MKRRISRVAAMVILGMAAGSVFSTVYGQTAGAGDAATTRPGGRVPPPARPNPLPPFYNPALSAKERADDLVSRLALEEKVALMQMASPAIERLGIAPYDWWSEALHGVARNGVATVFPQAIGMAASWDPELMKKIAGIIGIEGRAKHLIAVGNNDFGRYKGLDFWSPNVNLFRDPRWGRGQETYGEDPYLSGRMAIGFVTGLQGDDPNYFLTIATPKHYAVHSGPEPLRHMFNAVVTDQDLYTSYLPQFEATVKEAKAYSIMSAYSALNGVPNSGNDRLLNKILRDQWGFNGYVVSDVDSVSDIYKKESHAFVPSAVEASALAVKSGNDLNSGDTYGVGVKETGVSALASAVSKGLISQKEIDVAIGRLMEARIRVGEFDPAGYSGNPYNKITRDMFDLPEHDAAARLMADESMVLLKNDNKTLPLKSSVGKIAVIGPYANAMAMQYGNYNGNASEQHRVTILDGVRNVVGAARVVTTENKPPIVSDRVVLAELIKPEYIFTTEAKIARGLSVTVSPLAPGKAPQTLTSETGELRVSDEWLASGFNAVMKGVLVPPATGDYQLGLRGVDGYSLKIDGKEFIEDLKTIAHRTSGNSIRLEKGKTYAIEIQYTRNNGKASRISNIAPFGATTEKPGVVARSDDDLSGKPLLQMAWTLPTAEGDPADVNGKNLYAESLDAVNSADAVILVVGIDANLEAEETQNRYVGFAGGDRTAIELPMSQENLVKQVARAAGKKPVILVNCSGSAIAFNWASENIPAIIQAWYPGQRGDAVADVVFGKYNPAGRLPVTFYKSTDDLPDFTDYSMANRTYRYFTKPVLYPFGHGLSYSAFEYSGAMVPEKATIGDDVKVTVTVKNTSAVDGEEVVQCYLNRDMTTVAPKTQPAAAVLSDEEATLAATPRKSLVGFSRVKIKAGESKTVTFTLTPQQMSLVVGKDGKREVRPEKFQVQLGGTSAMAGSVIQPLTLEGAPKSPEYRFVAPSVK